MPKKRQEPCRSLSINQETHVTKADQPLHTLPNQFAMGRRSPRSQTARWAYHVCNFGYYPRGRIRHQLFHYLCDIAFQTCLADLHTRLDILIPFLQLAPTGIGHCWLFVHLQLPERPKYLFKVQTLAPGYAPFLFCLGCF